VPCEPRLYARPLFVSLASRVSRRLQRGATGRLSSLATRRFSLKRALSRRVRPELLKDRRLGWTRKVTDSSPSKAGAINCAEIAERGRTARGRFASPGIGLMVREGRQETATMPVRIVRLEDRVDAAGGRIFLGSPRHAGHQSARRTPVTATNAGTTTG